MFCVVYKFEAVEGRESDFEKSWLEITKDIYEKYGSLGSRLHKTGKSSYFAYAQWPDEASWKNMWDSDQSYHPMYKLFVESKKTSEVIFQGLMTEDYLQMKTVST